MNLQQCLAVTAVATRYAYRFARPESPMYPQNGHFHPTSSFVLCQILDFRYFTTAAFVAAVCL